LGHNLEITSQKTVVQVKEAQVQLASSIAVSPQADQLSGHRAQRQGKQQGPQRVTLLQPRLRRKEVLAKHQVGASTVTPFNPATEPRHKLRNPTEEDRPIDAIKSILKIDLNNHLVGIACVAKTPLPEGVDSNLSAQTRPTASA